MPFKTDSATTQPSTQSSDDLTAGNLEKLQQEVQQKQQQSQQQEAGSQERNLGHSATRDGTAPMLQAWLSDRQDWLQYYVSNDGSGK